MVHDYAGHPFQVQLSRYLAGQGIRTHHLYSASTATPQADLAVKPDDAKAFHVQAINLGSTIKKYNFVSRFFMEHRYGKLLVDECRRIRPSVVLSANTPSLSQIQLVRYAKRNEIRCVTWVQDMYGLAAYRILRKKIPIAGAAAGRYLMHLDASAYRQSDAVVAITEDFAPSIYKVGVEPSKFHAIHNWAPLEQFPRLPRDNAWSKENLTGEKTRFIYSGTLSIRHNPALLLELAVELERTGRGELLVISQGEAVRWLESQAQEKRLGSLRTLPFQPLERLAEVMASADVLLAILEPDAGVFCVPSKVLTYMCAGRAILAAIPAENLAARLIVDHGMGLNSDPRDTARFVANAMQLAEDGRVRDSMGGRARQYAESNFDIRKIGSRFASLLGVELPVN